MKGIYPQELFQPTKAVIAFIPYEKNKPPGNT